MQRVWGRLLHLRPARRPQPRLRQAAALACGRQLVIAGRPPAVGHEDVNVGRPQACTWSGGDQVGAGVGV